MRRAGRRVVRLSGAATARIRLERSGGTGIEQVATIDKGVAADALTMQASAKPAPAPR